MCVNRICKCGGTVTKRILDKGVVTFHCDMCGYETNNHYIQTPITKVSKQINQHVLDEDRKVKIVLTGLIISCGLFLVVFFGLLFYF